MSYAWYRPCSSCDRLIPTDRETCKDCLSEMDRKPKPRRRVLKARIAELEAALREVRPKALAVRDGKCPRSTCLSHAEWIITICDEALAPPTKTEGE